MKRFVLLAMLALAATAGGLVYTGQIKVPEKLAAMVASKTKRGVPPPPPAAAPPAVTVIRVEPGDFVETVLVTGSLVAREEFLVAPEIEGLRIVELLVEEGERVTKGQVLARLVQETLYAQQAQNDAALARAAAAMAQAKSTIVQAEAALREAKNAFERAKPLQRSGVVSESVYDQREAAARTAEARLIAARDGLKVAEAEYAQVKAQRRELDWRMGRTEIVAPADGLVSRRSARMGSVATAGGADAMFRIIAKGEIELDAEVPEARLPRLARDQPVRVEVPGLDPVDGKVRLVAPEVDKATRLGRVRIFIGDKAGLRVGSFGRGLVETARGRGLAVPTAALLFSSDGAYVQVVEGGRVRSQKVRTGLSSGGRVAVREGLAEGDIVVARAGTFLRDGDVVNPVLNGKGPSTGEGPRVTEVR